MKESIIKTITVEDRVFAVRVVSALERSYVTFKLTSEGHPHFFYDEIIFPIKDETEVEEVIELFSTTTEVIEFDALSRNMDTMSYLDEVLKVPVSERTSKLHLIYRQGD